MRKICKIIVAALSIGLLGSGAYGETIKGEPSTKVENIVVTAQKKEENMQQVPISMDVFSEMDLQDAKIETTHDLIKFSPNVHMKQSHVEHAVVIRGISSFHSSVYSPAGYYVDDISYPLHYMQNTGLMDIERAEVLKGPQGTLYGRNSESGVINIITRQPGNEFQGKITSEYGSYNTLKAGTSISGPLVENKLFLGGSFQHLISDGFSENEITGDTVQDQDHTNGRATLRWTPNDQMDISILGNIMKNDDHGGGFRYISGPLKTDRFKVRKDCDEYVDQDENSQALRIKYRGENLDILWATSALHQTLDKQNDADGWDNPNRQQSNIFKIKEQMLSQEIRISSSHDGPFEWLTGLYGFTEKTRFDFKYDFTSQNKVIMHPVTDIDATGYAFFGQGTYTLGDKLHITAGLRYDHQELEGDLEDSVKDIAFNEEVTYNELLPKFTTGYDVSKDVMVYGSASKGYLVGGFNWLTISPDGFNYDPEYTWNYETGIKTSWLDNKLMVNLSVFHIDIEDKQVAEIDVSTLSSTISNAGKAHSSGLELQVKTRPVGGLDLFAGVGFNESKFDRFSSAQWNPTHTALVEKDYADNYLPYAPRYTYNAGFQYRSTNHLFFRADIFGTAKFYGDPANKSEQDAYQTINLTLGYESNSFDLYFWAKNVFDEEYCTWIMSRGNSAMGLDGAPQTFGVTATYRF